MNFKSRWANKKSKAKNGKSKKCWSAKHVAEQHHPQDDNMFFLRIKNIPRTADRELYWQANLETIFTGGNSRRDIQTVKKIEFNLTSHKSSFVFMSL